MRAKQARIKGLGIVSDAPAPGISELWGILANRAERCVVEDCRFERLSVGVLFTGAQACRASRCQARDCTGNGLLMYAASRFSQRLECKRPHPFRRPAVSCFPSHSRFPLGDNCNDFA
jgi:hypothetical protein